MITDISLISNGGKSGGKLGFILKALKDEGVTGLKLMKIFVLDSHFSIPRTQCNIRSKKQEREFNQENGSWKWRSNRISVCFSDLISTTAFLFLSILPKS